MSSLPTLQRAAILHQQDSGSFHFITENVALPQVSPTSVLVKLSCTGICGSDLHLASGHLGPVRSILGHEGVGRVVKHGSAIDLTDIPMGARVGIGWVRDVCGSCIACLHPAGEAFCVARMTGGRWTEGTFAEFAVVPARYVVRLPEDGLDVQVAPMLCGGVTAYKALKICGATPGKWIAISGAGGGVGSLSIQFAKAMGYRVLAIDVGKEEHCLDAGAEAYIETTKATTEAVTQITGGGVQAALVTAAVGKAYQAAVEFLAPFGTLVCIGIPPTDQVTFFHPAWFVDKGIRIIGSAVGTRGDLLEAVDFVSRGVVIPAVKVVSLDQLSEIAMGFSKVSVRSF